jgi:hypothetical protein
VVVTHRPIFHRAIPGHGIVYLQRANGVSRSRGRPRQESLCLFSCHRIISRTNIRLPRLPNGIYARRGRPAIQFRRPILLGTISTSKQVIKHLRPLLRKAIDVSHERLDPRRNDDTRTTRTTTTRRRSRRPRPDSRLAAAAPQKSARARHGQMRRPLLDDQRGRARKRKRSFAAGRGGGGVRRLSDDDRDRRSVDGAPRWRWRWWRRGW